MPLTSARQTRIASSAQAASLVGTEEPCADSVWRAWDAPTMMVSNSGQMNNVPMNNEQSKSQQDGQIIVHFLHCSLSR